VRECLPDGTPVTVIGEGVEADEHEWRQLDGRGWAVSIYLRPAT
jgi:hypothetical protein